MVTNNANSELIERDIEHLIHPLHSRKVQGNAQVWSHGEGHMLVNANGERFIDGLSGLWNNTAGNGRKELADAAQQQMMKMGFLRLRR